MRRIARAIGRFWRDQRGTEALEWGLVCGLIVVGAITAIATIGPKVVKFWSACSKAIKDLTVP
jgi:Flp pilus assembly pilin Flp